MENNTMGMRIRDQRKKMGMTQEELAERLCVKKATISMYENDKVDIKSSIVVELAELLGTTTGYLMNNEVVADQMDGMDKEIMDLFRGLDNYKIRQIAIEQLKVLSTLSK